VEEAGNVGAILVKKSTSQLVFAANRIAGGMRKAEIKIAFVDAVTRSEPNHSGAKQRPDNRERGQQKESLREF
jgi:hypothetical protein